MRKHYFIIFVLILVVNVLLRRFVLGPEWQDSNLLVNVFIAFILTSLYIVIEKFIFFIINKNRKNKK